MDDQAAIPAEVDEAPAGETPDAAVKDASESSAAVDSTAAAPDQAATPAEVDEAPEYYGDTYEYRVVKTGSIDEPGYAQNIEDALNASGAFGFRVNATIETHGHVLIIMAR